MKLGTHYHGLQPIMIYVNHDLWLTLSFFMTRSKMVKNGHIENGRYKQLTMLMNYVSIEGQGQWPTCPYP